MFFKQLLKMVFINIYCNKVRTFLTTLGVIVGTATIFLVVAIGNGGEAQVNEQYSRLNAGSIFVMPASRGKVVSPLNEKDVELFQQSDNIATVFPILSGKGDISYNNYSTNGSYSGIMPEFQEPSNLIIQEGKLISPEDESKKKRSTVLGYDLADTLTDGDVKSIVGETINIDRRSFEVIGVLQRIGDSGSMGGSYDETAFLPYSSAKRFLLGSKANPIITVQAIGIETVQSAIEDITEVLDENHRNGGAEQFRIRDAGSRLVAAQESAETMSLLLLSVAIIVLVVSGIGIMNVMFVTVKERTKEIGTLKAIGAKKREILAQFLAEAVVISMVGGVMGIILGGIALPILRYFEFPALPSLSAILLSLLFSVVTGVFFGFYPALKAAELNPIEALRYE